MSFVTKRDGRIEEVSYDKITRRIKKLINPVELSWMNLEKETEYLKPTLIAMKVIPILTDNINTETLDIVSADICVDLSTIHPSYAHLGGRILISNLHKKTCDNFTDKMKLLADAKIINSRFYDYVVDNMKEFNDMINYNFDYMYDYFGYKTLEKSYLLKINNNIIERPQDMLLRVAISLQFGNIDMIRKTYNSMAIGLYTHASPTLFNAGTNHMQLSSCFVEDTEVITSNGVKKIQDVKIGDMITTHTGVLHKVVQLHKNKLNDRKVMKLEVARTKPINVTANHKFWSIDRNNVVKWRSVDMMNEDCYIAIPHYNNHTNINIDFARIIGFYITNGSSIKCNSIKFTLNDTKITQIIKNYFKNYVINTTDYEIVIKINTTDFYDNIMDNICKLDMNRTMVLYILSTIISSQYAYEDNMNIAISFDEIYANKLYHFFRMYGFPVMLIDYTLYFPKSIELLEKSFKQYNIIGDYFDMDIKVHDKITYLQVKSISETGLYPEYVYTLGVNTDHSYNVEGLICENCFLLGTADDLSSITKTWNSCAMISKWAGGIGLHVSNIRGKDSHIHGTGGKSNGIVPFLKVFNDIARWIDQGGRRPGSIAIYLEPHHPDIMEFLDLRKNFGSETERARDLFLALWISDLFMKQVECDGDWYLMSSDECPDLNNTYGDEYEMLYWSYVKMNKYRTMIPARKVWLAILEAQIETGMPYISFKDSINKKSNQKNIGIIRSSNLCIEIVQYSDDMEYAVCNLASIALKQFVIPYKFDTNTNMEEWIIYSKDNCKYCDYTKNYLASHNIKYKEIPYSSDNMVTLKSVLKKDSDYDITFPQIFLKLGNIHQYVGGWNEFYKKTCGTFDFDKLYDTSYLATVNLNQVIDINYYPVPETKLSNMKHRPIGLGIQGLADALVLLRIPFDSDEAVEFNAKVMETIYLASVTASNDMAKERTKDIYELIMLDYNFPEYYDMNHIIADTDINTIYHKIKPCKYELNKEKNSTTIGAYSTFDGSPMSKGLFQFDMWDKSSYKLNYPEKWAKLREAVIKYGTRNSMLTALMPTASTSQILGNNECFEFFTNNIYSRKTQAGTFVMVCKYLVNDLIKVGLWNNELKDSIISMDGSIQNIKNIPQEFKLLYKTMWEIKQVWVLKAAAARGPFVDQTQSMNIFMAYPDYQRLGSSHFWGWKNGLKTGMYYLRTKPSSDAVKFTIDPNLIKNNTENNSCENCSA